MKLKIISLIVVFVFVVSMFPANLFANSPAFDFGRNRPIESLLIIGGLVGIVIYLIVKPKKNK